METHDQKGKAAPLAGERGSQSNNGSDASRVRHQPKSLWCGRPHQRIPLCITTWIRPVTVITEPEADELLGDRTASIKIVSGLPTVVWFDRHDKIITAREMAHELGNYAVVVDGEDEPVWLLEWAFGRPAFLAKFGPMTEDQLEKEFPGFDRAAYERELERRRADDGYLREFLMGAINDPRR
jgi:hypothetical protein